MTYSLRNQALIAAGKQVAHARGDDGAWRLDVFVDAILAVTEADKAEAVAAARREVIEEISSWSDQEADGASYGASAEWALAALDTLLRRLATKAGITVDTTTEEKP